MGPDGGPTKALEREKKNEKRKTHFEQVKGGRPPMCSHNINLKWEKESTKLKFKINQF